MATDRTLILPILGRMLSLFSPCSFQQNGFLQTSACRDRRERKNAIAAHAATPAMPAGTAADTGPRSSSAPQAVTAGCAISSTRSMPRRASWLGASTSSQLRASPTLHCSMWRPPTAGSVGVPGRLVKVHNKALVTSYTLYVCGPDYCDYRGEMTAKEPAPLPPTRTENRYIDAKQIGGGPGFFGGLLGR
jgi:hypothetical protein